MKTHLKSFKKITCILGIAFLVMGTVPLPAVVQVVPTPEAAAAKPAGGSWGISPADFSGINLFAGDPVLSDACLGYNVICRQNSTIIGSCCSGMTCTQTGAQNWRCRAAACTPGG